MTMSDYTTPTPEMQEGTSGKSNKKQQSTTWAAQQARRGGRSVVALSREGRERPLKPSPSGPGLYRDRFGHDVPALRDSKYEWRQKKQKTLAVATLYRATDDHQHADRVVSCATWLQYLADQAGDKRTLQAFNPCHLRLCPLCANRKARQMTARLVRILTAVKAEHPEATLLFLTLTVKNVPGNELRDTLAKLTKGWDRLAKRRPFLRAVLGWFRAVEITYNPTTDEYHAHIHAIAAVDGRAYFRVAVLLDRKGNEVKGEDDKAIRSLYANGLYIPHGRDDRDEGGNLKTPDWYKGPFWVDMWRDCMRLDYDPSVRISKVTGPKGEQRDTDAASYNAVLEAAKYATKDSDYLNGKMPEAVRAGVLATYTAALHRKRLVALGGWLADAAQGLDLEDDGDLVHGDEPSDEDLTAATAEMLESYGWHFGVGEHVLKDRTRNPDYTGQGGKWKRQ